MEEHAEENDDSDREETLPPQKFESSPICRRPMRFEIEDRMQANLHDWYSDEGDERVIPPSVLPPAQRLEL